MGIIELARSKPTPFMSVTATESPRVNRYVQLCDELRQRIVVGDFKPGDRLPSFTEMRQQYGVSQSTLERAHGMLELEGLIERKRGAGTFVLEMKTNGHANSHVNGKPAKPSFLNRAIAVFTPFAKPVEAHQASGWLEWIGQSAINQVQAAGRHVVTLHPEISGEELEALVSDRPLGVLVSAVITEDSLPLTLIQKLRQANIPVVAYGGDPQQLGCDCVLSDHEQGGYELTRLLIEKGCRHILNVCPDGETSYWYRQRFAGYERAMREAELEILPAVKSPVLHELSQTHRVGVQAALKPAKPAVNAESDKQLFRRDVKNSAGHFIEYLTGSNPVDALMMVTDRNVYLAAAVCRMLGKDPNSDVLVTGYDNYFLDCEERALEPFTPLATVDKNNGALGAAMAHLLLERTEGQLPSPSQIRCVSPTLVVVSH